MKLLKTFAIVTSGVFAVLFSILFGLLYIPTLFAAHWASVRVPDIETSITLQFYRTFADKSGGRYLTISTPSYSVRREIDGWDWFYQPRTSIYETRNREIVVSDNTAAYIFDPNTLELRSLFPWSNGDDWTYIGALDYDETGENLQFFSSSQEAECLMTATSSDREMFKMFRVQYRKNWCKSYKKG